RNKTSNHEQSNFTASFDTKLQVESNERITSVLCLPIASTIKRSLPEWTCIIVGFTTGYVRMYTEMACSLNTVSKIDDLSRIRAILLPHLLDSIVDNDYQTTDTDATEDDEIPTSESVARTAALLPTYEKKKKKTSRDRNQLLRDCQLAFSPTLNLLVFAFDQQIVVSTG
ncbi:unnamed protein product, partial [Rotaria sp. Silwood1]